MCVASCSAWCNSFSALSFAERSLRLEDPFLFPRLSRISSVSGVVSLVSVSSAQDRALVHLFT